MKPSEFFLEFARPFLDSTVLVGMVVFTALGALAQAAGLFGLWLAVIVVPALCRFLFKVMQARIDQRPVEPPGIELFSLVENIWMLLPVVLIGLGAIAVSNVAAQGSPLAAALLGVVILWLLPASLGSLGLTHSAAAALNPLVMWELVRRCGARYAAVPFAVAASVTVVVAFAWAGAPQWLLTLLELYPLFLLFSMTGAVVAASGARELVGAENPLPPVPDRRRQSHERQRNAVLNHAYALSSRGNCSGGLAHIKNFIENSEHDDGEIDEIDWFFRRMMDWEQSLPALTLGQHYLSALLAAGETSRALKILSRCLLVDARFRPLPEDRERLLELARQAGRDDLATNVDQA